MAGKSFEEKIAQVLEYKTTNTYPEGMSKGRQFILRQFAANFSLEGRKVVVVHTMKEVLNLFQQYHSSAHGGHQGVRKTRVAMTSRHYWPGMANDIANWVAQCPDCQKVGKEFNVDTTLKSIKVTQPWELVGMDLIGPLPMTKNGYQYIMTATDYFTRWVEAFPLRKKSANEVVNNIYKMILRFGCPRRILSRHGSEFNNTLNLEFCQKFKIERSFTSPYHPQTNRVAESTNKSIKRVLRKCVDESESNWDEYLDGVLFSLRSKPSMTTKMSPFRLLYGFEALFPDQVPENYTLPNVSELSEEDYKDYIRDLESRKAADAALALKNLSEAQEKQQRQHSKRQISKHGKTTFEVGQSVLLLNARRRTRKGGSLQPTYLGPYKLTSVVGKRVTLETMSGKVLGSMYSICHLKPFKGPAPLVTDDISEENVVIQTAVEDIEKKNPPEDVCEMSGDEHHGTADSIARNIEVIKKEEEDCVAQAFAIHEDSDVDDTVLEVGEVKEWFQKVRLLQTHRHGSRLEAKVGNIRLFGSSFHGLKPGGWLGDEVIDAYFFCVVKRTSAKVQAISSVISTSILAGRAGEMKLKKRGIIQKDIVLLPFNASKHWVIVIALMERKELLIIDPLCQETTHERALLRNWRSFIYQETGKSTKEWKTKILEHKTQSDGHSCGPLILRFAETYLEHEDISTVETTEEAMNSFRRQIAIHLLKESDSVEDCCIYCNFVTCPDKTDCMMVQCDSCKRWAHIPCLPDGTNEENLHDEYKCNKCA